jgi:RimJ/RimL family protein N-acetyltransferase
MSSAQQTQRKHKTQNTKHTKHTKKLMHKPQKDKISIELTDIRKSDRPELIEITGKPNIMKFIGLGNTWTPQDVDKYINYTIQDAKISTAKRTWFSYAIRHRNKLIGVIEFKCISIYKILPLQLRKKYQNDVALTIYINDTYQGKGVARMALEQLKAKIRKLKPRANKLISLVKSTNPVMQQAMTKLGFNNTGLIGVTTPQLIVYTTSIKSQPL